MNTTTNIIKSIVIPIVKESAKVDILSVSDGYWNQLANVLIHFETNAAPIYEKLYALDLDDPEYVFNQLPDIYANFIRDHAEDHVRGNESVITKKLIETRNGTFLKEVSFLKTMNDVITKNERERLKKDLPQAYDRLVFELDDKMFEAVAKKKSREDLKNKFKQWDKDLIEEKHVLEKANYDLTGNYLPPEQFPPKSINKFIIQSWTKYAVAASIVLFLGVWFYKSSTKQINPESSIASSAKKQKTTKIDQLLENDSISLAEISTSKSASTVLVNSLGFNANIQIINIVIKNQYERISSVNKAIDRYQICLNHELASDKQGSGKIVNEIRSRISLLQVELQNLKERDEKYIFDGKELTMFISVQPSKVQVLFSGGIYYLKKDSQFSRLQVTDKAQPFKPEVDSNVLKALGKVIFKNE